MQSSYLQIFMNSQILNINTKNNIGWIDALRVTACFMVVLSHCCDAFVAQFETSREMFMTGVFCGSLMRPCVPLFAMITATLLLPVNNGTTLNSFYRKRIGRIIPPLFFWSLVLPALMFVYLNFINPGTRNPQFIVDSYTTEQLLQRLYTFIFNFNFDTTPLWYLYMLIGLYITMPILSSWLEQADKKDIKTVLYIWGVTLLLPYIKLFAPALGYQGNYGNMGLFGECDWNVYGTFYYVSGFIGYVILAYYLKKYPLNWNWKKIAVICIPMFLVGYAITSVGFIITNEYFPGNYAYLEIIWYFTGINVFMMTFPIFIIFRHLNATPRKWLSTAASLTFGIYLCHFVFTFPCYDILDTESLPYIVRILLAAVMTFAVSLAVTYILSKNKITEILIK